MPKRIELTRPQRREIQRMMAKSEKRKIKDPKAHNRLNALNMRVQGFTNAQIGAALGFSPTYITELVNKFRQEGMDAILASDKRTSNNRHMSFEQEAAFLEQFVELAEAGQIITVEGILKKFQEATGSESGTSTIYALLKRHGWRKLKPRPRHPNAPSEAEMEASKKLTKNSDKSYWKKIEETKEIIKTATSNTSELA